MSYEEYFGYMLDELINAMNHKKDYGEIAFNEFDIVEPEDHLEMEN